VGIPLSPENGVRSAQRISSAESPESLSQTDRDENLEYFAGLYGLIGAEARIKDALRRSTRVVREISAWTLQGAPSAGGVGTNVDERSGDHVPRRADIEGLDPVAAREVHDLINGSDRRG